MAIDDLLDEHEQSERVLAWLRRNGAALVGGVALGLGAIGGWNWWQVHQLKQAGAGAGAYQAAVDALEAGTPKAEARVKALPASYSALAALHLAASQVEAGKRDAAIATLRAVKTEQPGMRDIVDARLARLLIDAKQADAAMKLLAGRDTPMAAEIRGDAHVALRQVAQARKAYEDALRKLDVAAPTRRLLELKLTEVGGTPATPKGQS